MKFIIKIKHEALGFLYFSKAESEKVEDGIVSIYPSKATLISSTAIEPVIRMIMSIGKVNKEDITVVIAEE